MTDRPKPRLIWMMWGASALLFAWGWYARSYVPCLLAVGLASFTLATVASRLRGPLVSFGTLALALALAETIAVVAARATESATGELYYAPSYRAPVSDLGRTASPGVHSSHHRSTAGDVIYDVTYAIGPDGFRVTPAAPADGSLEVNSFNSLGVNSIEVNFFGCSFTFGEGVADDQTFPAYVQAALPGSSAKNFGFHGYGVHHALAILTSDRNTDGQVNFLLTGPWHAPRSACVPEWSAGHPKYRIGEGGVVERVGSCNKQTLPLRLIGYSALATALRLERFLDPPQDEQIELYLGLIAEIERISTARGQKLVIGYMRAGDDWFSGEFDDERVLDRLSALGIPIRDLTLGSSAFDMLPEYRLHAEDPHPTPRAHRERAALAAQLITSVTGTPDSLAAR
jgi:hypothetical protein